MKVAVVSNRESRKVIILFGTPNRETIGLESLKCITEAFVLCGESTSRHRAQALQGYYQVVYRSVETCRSVLVDSGFEIVSVQPNTAYINVQMACELIKKWKALVGTDSDVSPSSGAWRTGGSASATCGTRG